MNGCTRQTIEHRQVFVSAIDTATTHTPVFRITGSLDGLICSRLIDIIASSVLTAWSRLTHQFCLAVLIKIIYQELRIVGTCTDIVTQINTPKFGAIQFIAVNIDAARVSATDGVVLRSRRIPLHEYLILSIAIHIAHAAIIGRIGVFLTDGRAIGLRT